LLNRLGDSGFERLHVVARGVETMQFNPMHRSADLRASWGVADDDLVVLSVGRLAPEKNLGLLAQAFAAMQQVNPRVHLVVVGDGPSRHELQALCPAARCVGAKTGESLAAHYASADVFLFPSLTETYGNVTPEAMASGLAVLAFDYAAAAELVRHGDNGLVVPVTDEAAFLRRAADLAASPEQVRALRSRARETTLGRDWAHIAAQVESIWLGLLPPMTQPDALHAPRASRAPWPQPATAP
jgi:glycosyltransferase involved in cell wall biosynthesis